MLLKMSTAIAVAVAVLAAPTPGPTSAECDAMAIPLTKHSNTDALAFLAASSNTIIRDMESFERNTGMAHSSPVKRDGSTQSSGAGLHLTKYRRMMWYGTISIGTPPKSFTVQLDTGCSDLFVPASTGDENCRSHANLWDSALSQTANLALDKYYLMQFADGSIVAGKGFMDNVTIAGFTADIQTIGAATTYSSRFAAPGFAPDGVLGLAFPSRSVYSASPLFHTLFSEGKLPQAMFSLKLADSGAELFVGGMNKALYIESTLAFVPVTYPFFWELMIDNIQVNNKIVLTDVPAIIDIGANFIFGDLSRVSALHQAYGGKAFENGYYTFPCISFPSVTFTIGGKSFLIPANILDQGRVTSGSRDCFSGIMTLDAEYNSWTIGTLFLQRFYTVFDFGSEPPRVGFAKLART